MLLHRFFRHLNQRDVKKKALVTSEDLNEVCDVCALGKITKTSVPKKAESQATQKLERVFMDFRGPFSVDSLHESFHCFVKIDQSTNFVLVCFMKT